MNMLRFFHPLSILIIPLSLQGMHPLGTPSTNKIDELRRLITDKMKIEQQVLTSNEGKTKIGYTAEYFNAKCFFCIEKDDVTYQLTHKGILIIDSNLDIFTEQEAEELFTDTHTEFLKRYPDAVDIMNEIRKDSKPYSGR